MHSYIEQAIPQPTLVVLAGGFGTRLKSLVSDVPKPLAPIDGVPFLKYLLDDWIESGIAHFVFLLHHEAVQIQNFVDAYFSHESRGKLGATCIVEPVPLGTGGALRHAITQAPLPDEILVANADTWLPGCMRQLIEETGNCMAAVRVADASRYGLIRTQGDIVKAFTEKGSNTGGGIINAGSYRLKTSLLKQLPKDKPCSLEESLLGKLSVNNELRYILSKSSFIDIGIPSDYKRFQFWIEGGAQGEL